MALSALQNKVLYNTLEELTETKLVNFWFCNPGYSFFAIQHLTILASLQKLATIMEYHQLSSQEKL